MEYTRVHSSTDFGERWVKFIEDYGPNHCVVAQLLGNDPVAMRAAVERLNDLPVAEWTSTSAAAPRLQG
jgi:hypothetical protein